MKKENTKLVYTKILKSAYEKLLNDKEFNKLCTIQLGGDFIACIINNTKDGDYMDSIIIASSIQNLLDIYPITVSYLGNFLLTIDKVKHRKNIIEKLLIKKED